jgi:hypothetical protein
MLSYAKHYVFIPQHRCSRGGKRSPIISLIFIKPIFSANVDESITLWKPIIGIDGSEITTLNITKGTDFILVVISAQRDPEIWGQLLFFLLVYNS